MKINKIELLLLVFGLIFIAASVVSYLFNWPYKNIFGVAGIALYIFYSWMSTTKLNKEVRELQADVTEKEGTIANLKNEKQSLQQEQKKLQSKLKGLEGDLKKLKEELNQVKEELRAKEEELNKAKKTTDKKAEPAQTGENNNESS